MLPTMIFHGLTSHSGVWKPQARFKCLKTWHCAEYEWAINYAMKIYQTRVGRKWASYKKMRARIIFDLVRVYIIVENDCETMGLHVIETDVYLNSKKPWISRKSSQEASLRARFTLHHTVATQVTETPLKVSFTEFQQDNWKSVFAFEALDQFNHLISTECWLVLTLIPLVGCKSL